MKNNTALYCKCGKKLVKFDYIGKSGLLRVYCKHCESFTTSESFKNMWLMGVDFGKEEKAREISKALGLE